jgi:hypothetical protein
VSSRDVPVLGCIVEGEGDERALPLLVRRIASLLTPPVYVDFFVGKRAPRSALVQPGGIERAVEETVRVVGSQGALLMLLDADDDCPATLGPSLLRRAEMARPDCVISLVRAKREYEAWFLAAATSLAGVRGLPSDLQSPSNPEGIRGAKEWLRARLPRGNRYREVVDQPALTAMFDLEQARSADSFDKCYREIVRLLTVLTQPARHEGDQSQNAPAP